MTELDTLREEIVALKSRGIALEIDNAQLSMWRDDPRIRLTVATEENPYGSTLCSITKVDHANGCIHVECEQVQSYIRELETRLKEVMESSRK